MVVEVEDDGPGFSREYLKHPFQANVQSHRGDSRERQHLGIGLALAAAGLRIVLPPTLNWTTLAPAGH